MKQKLSLSLIFVCILILLSAAALASGIVYGIDWVYSSSPDSTSPFVYYDNGPLADKCQSIVNNAQTNISQTVDASSAPVRVTVTGASWVNDYSVLAIVVNAAAVDPAAYELHAMSELDPDGAYIGPDGIPLYEEEHTEHLLWVRNSDGSIRHGPVRDMMTDNSKKLLLYEITGVEVCGYPFDMASIDITMPDGTVVSDYEFGLDWMNPEWDKKIAWYAESYPDNAAYWHSLAAQGKAVREQVNAAIASGTDIPCELTFRTVEYEEGNDAELYSGGETYTLQFSVKLNN